MTLYTLRYLHAVHRPTRLFADHASAACEAHEGDVVVPLDPAECWDVFVGDQTPTEFVSQDGEAEDYVAQSPACADLPRDERPLLVAALRHVLRNVVVIDHVEGSVVRLSGPSLTVPSWDVDLHDLSCNWWRLQGIGIDHLLSDNLWLRLCAAAALDPDTLEA